jgi:hypothetical protein
MVTASVLALEEPTPDWIRTPTRRELHESFDHWLDTLEEAVKEDTPSLDALVRAVLANGSLGPAMPPSGPAPEVSALSPVWSVTASPRAGFPDG